jgi:hypothetical protein
MFSQYGIDENGDATNSDEYKYFNASDPYLETNKFRPNLCFNFKTGKV